MSKKRSLCFIDDDPNELARFKQAVGREFLVGVGTSHDKALEDLKTQGRRHVDLYVLDMYFPNEGINTSEELSKLGKAWDAFCTAEELSKPSLLNWGRVLREAAPWRDRSAPDVLSRGRPLCSSRERALSWMQLRRTNTLGAIRHQEARSKAASGRSASHKSL